MLFLCTSLRRVTPCSFAHARFLAKKDCITAKRKQSPRARPNFKAQKKYVWRCFIYTCEGVQMKMVRCVLWTAYMFLFMNVWTATGSTVSRPRTSGKCFLHSIKRNFVCVPCGPNEFARKSLLNVEYCEACAPGTRPSSYWEYCVNVSSSTRMAPSALGVFLAAILVCAISPIVL